MKTLIDHRYLWIDCWYNKERSKLTSLIVIIIINVNDGIDFSLLLWIQIIFFQIHPEYTSFRD